MKIPYFPGCTLHVKARSFDETTRITLAAFGLELAELPEWTCCGTVFPLARDNYMGMVAAARILANAAKQGGGRLVTVCSFCYNVLKRVNAAVKNVPEVRAKLNEYLEEDYGGDLAVVHPLELLRDEVGFEVLGRRVKGRLHGLKTACYYGCLLTRPADEMGFGDPENPVLMDEFAAALGVEPVDFSCRTRCCGSYQLLHNAELVAGRVREIVSAAANCGARVIITSCPLCQFNLDWGQARLATEDESFARLPVLYFTQFLALALGTPAGELGLERHYVDPRPLVSAI